LTKQADLDDAGRSGDRFVDVDPGAKLRDLV
jgi:hypothetical protein